MKMCDFCVMDETDPDFRIRTDPFERVERFHSSGHINGCNNCIKWFQNAPSYIPSYPNGNDDITEVLDALRRRAGGDYDAVLGVSGGLDSACAAYIISEIYTKYGMDILLVHLNDGWDSEEASHNVSQIVKMTGYDFEESYVDGTEFADLIRAYLRAGVVGIEAPTDNLIMTSLYDTMKKHHLNNIIGGNNFRAEGLAPNAWEYPLHDGRNIKSIHRHFGTIPLKNLKFTTTFGKFWFLNSRRIKELRILNEIGVEYLKNAKKNMINEWDIIEYGIKHYENRFTRFIEGYFYPKRFGFEKRRAHYSSMICGGLMTREEALRLMEQPYYKTDEALQSDKDFFLKNIGIDEDQFNEFLRAPVHQHTEFTTNKWDLRVLKMLSPVRKILKK